ncbi:MAG: sigma 54-interacting transcriptional regulator [Myxococcales bacterium]
MERADVNDLETEPEADPRPRLSGTPSDLGFVVLFSSEGSEHLGAWIPVPEGRANLLGRGAPREGDEVSKLEPVRQRPGDARRVPPFSQPALSRAQLLVKRLGSEMLLIENVGRCRVAVNGVETRQTTLGPGDLVEVGSQLLLICALRPRELAGPAEGLHEFGRADSYGFVGESPAAWRLRADVAAVAPRVGHVLILGATGTGKELVAMALHSRSGAGKLTSRNAATLPEALVDAELFGNLKNYPNPGTPDRPGLIGAADGGCLFLDEFAELPQSAQAHLLRALDHGEYQRLGEASVRHSRFRLIAATNRPESALRRDLLERFDFRLRVPTLSDRLEDIPFIARHLLASMAAEAPELCSKFAGADGLPKLSLSFVARLARHPFEGNVRELRSLLWAALHEAPGDGWLEWPRSATSHAEPQWSQPPAAIPTTELASGVREQIASVLEACGGNQRRAAEMLGMPRRTLVRRIAELGIPRPRKPTD